MKKLSNLKQYTKLNQMLSIYGVYILISGIILLLLEVFILSRINAEFNSYFVAPIVLMLSAGFIIGYLIDYNKFKKSKTKMNLYNAVSYMLLSGLIGINFWNGNFGGITVNLSSDYYWIYAIIISLVIGVILLKTKNGADATSKIFMQIFSLATLLMLIPLIVQTVSFGYPDTNAVLWFLGLATNLFILLIPLIALIKLKIKNKLENIYYSMYITALCFTLLNVVSNFSAQSLYQIIDPNNLSAYEYWNMSLFFLVPALICLLFVLFIFRLKKSIKV